ncbi:MAG: polyprenyl synthetase family protein [Thermodesulfobacteriota bacterium]
MDFNVSDYLSSRKDLIDKKLSEYLLKSKNDLGKLHESMLYSVMAGGKRLRPVLCIASCEVFGGEIEKALPVACAIEMIHTYSLIHDDLPSMDDDLLRRGKPTNHSVYGEALAILAGDALLTDAFYFIVDEGISSGLKPALLINVIKDIAKASGSHGMVGGQAIDLSLEGSKEVTIEMSKRVHSLKTGALIEVSVTTGAKIGGANSKELYQLNSYSKALGLAFQIMDDVLDIEGGGEIGKNTGGDARRKKATYPSLIGVKNARRMATDLTNEAINALENFGSEAVPLRELAHYLGGRTY